MIFLVLLITFPLAILLRPRPNDSSISGMWYSSPSAPSSTSSKSKGMRLGGKSRAGDLASALGGSSSDYASIEAQAISMASSSPAIDPYEETRAERERVPRDKYVFLVGRGGGGGGSTY